MNIEQAYEYIQSRSDWTEDEQQDLLVKLLEWDKEEKELSKAFIQQCYTFSKIDEVRKARRRAELNETHGGWETDEFHPDPLDQLIHEEEVGARMDSLSPLLMDTLVDYYIHGRTPEEIADEQGENVWAIRKRIERARNTMKGETA